MPRGSQNDVTLKARHPIAVVAERTGLSQDVLRVWERRYGAVKPARGSGGQRLYSDADVDRLRLLDAATRAGRSISHVAGDATRELARMVDEDAAARRVTSPTRVAAADTHEAIVAEALRHTLALDGAELTACLRRANALLGVPVFVDRVAAPILRRVGEEWHSGRLSPAHEHLASSAVHDVLSQSMRASATGREIHRIVVATPAGDRHAIGATLIGALAAAGGWSVTYLGADLPAADIAAAASATGADLVALSLVYAEDRLIVLKELRSIRALLPASIPLLVGGAGTASIRKELIKAGIQIGDTLDDLRAALRL